MNETDPAAEAIARLGAKPASPFLAALMVALAALLIVCVSLVILVGVVASKSHDDQVTQEAADCRNLYNGQVADATKAASDAVGQMMVELVRAVVNRTPTSPPFDPSRTNAAVAAWDKASADYGAALADRNAWVADGTPLPCPLKPGG